MAQKIVRQRVNQGASLINSLKGAIGNRKQDILRILAQIKSILKKIMLMNRLFSKSIFLFQFTYMWFFGWDLLRSRVLIQNSYQALSCFH